MSKEHDIFQKKLNTDIITLLYTYLGSLGDCLELVILDVTL